jgi:tetratricopeptide (TPR) repeat protein
MLRFICFILFCSCFQFAFCRQYYPGTPNDKIEIQRLIDSLNKKNDATYEACTGTIYKAINLVHKSNNLYYAQILIQEGYLLNELGQYEKAAYTFDSAGRIYARLHDTHGQVNCLNKAGFCYVFASNYELASERLFHGIELAEQHHETYLLSNLFVNTGLLYESLEDYDNALEFAKKAIPLKLQLKDKKGVAKIYNNIGNLFSYTNKHDSAITNLTLAINMHRELKDTLYWLNSLISLGSAFLFIERSGEALVHLQKAEQLVLLINDHADEPGLYSNLSFCYLTLGKKDMAGKYAQMAYKSGKGSEDFTIRKNIFEALYKYNKAIGNTTMALKYFEQLQIAADTLNAESRKIEYQRAAIRYEMGKKTIADSLQAESKVLVANTKTEQTKNTLLLVALLLVIALATTIALYNRSKLLAKKAIIAQQEKQLADQVKDIYRLRALQAQMNPHFIFNCFNTIESYILQNKQLEASILVQRFSKLSRRILEQTSLDSIRLEEEMETLNTYLQIEQMRSGNTFDFEIKTNNTNLSCPLPPMLLQPFVENAIIHGLRPLEERRGHILVEVEDGNKIIKVTISDNGIGMAKANALKQQKQDNHRSLSMTLTLERLKAMHSHTGVQNYLTISAADNKGNGTLVTIILPKPGADAQSYID